MSAGLNPTSHMLDRKGSYVEMCRGQLPIAAKSDDQMHQSTIAGLLTTRRPVSR